MNPDPARQIGDLVRQHRTFLVAGHYRPDGDVLGCQIALGLALQGLGKTVEVWNSDGLPQKYSFLPQSKLLQKPPAAARDFDAVIAVDTATYERLGVTRDRIASRKALVNMDHHASNERFGDLVWIEPRAAASAELVHHLLRVNNWPVTADIAANLYVGLSTDTGSFQYSSTSPQTLRIAAELLEAGADGAELSRLCYQSFPLRRLRLLQLILASLSLRCEGRVASFWITDEMFRQTGALPEDTENLIDHVRAIDSVVVAALFEAGPGGIVRVSLRSKSPKVSVDAVAAKFGGGGHAAAAGARIQGEPATVEAAVLGAIENALREARL
ncbi:MAG: DHH family phosphoesterase [Verrucomicrobia bacterium]|nr:DHH family phosphoesterase [Verrucomicrobiota bacterium]